LAAVTVFFLGLFSYGFFLISTLYGLLLAVRIYLLFTSFLNFLLALFLSIILGFTLGLTVLFRG
jgi:hypothetical protein